jgi:acyl-coenzyme A thioesterase PaaI-like protein
LKNSAVFGESMSTSNRAIQDLYPDDLAHCFGCGRNNPSGHQLKSFSEGDEVVAHFTPAVHQISIPGFVYGGLLASIADCHAMATAAAATELAAGRRLGDGPAPRFITAALRVDYLKPTPLGVELEIRGHVTERSEKKAIVAVTIAASGTITVRAEVVAVRIPKGME